MTADVVEGIELLGAEMLTWSDYDSSSGPLRGRVAALLLHSFGGSRERVLIAGPHDVGVILEVAAQFASTDVVVRSWLDAQNIRPLLPDGVGVFCGPLGRMKPGAGYDAVVAVDGLHRLHSTEETQPSWSTTAAQLAGLLRPGGELYLGLGNDAGVDSLLTLSPDHAHDHEHWPDGHTSESALDTSIEELSAYFDEDQGLARIETWACHGNRHEPLLAAPTRLLEEHRSDPRLAGLVARAYADGLSDGAAVKDPVEVAQTVVRRGLGSRLAPRWVLHFRRGDPAADSTLPDRLIVAEPVEDQGAVGYFVEVTAAGWTRSVVTGKEPVELAPGAVREPVRLDGPVPSARSLEELLVGLCAAQDMVRTGDLVRRYRTWLGESADVPAERVALTLDALGVEPGTDEIVVLDASRLATAAAPADEIAVRALLVFAEHLLARGVRHPWNLAVSPLAVARELAAAADWEVDEALAHRAEVLDGRLRSRSEREVRFAAPGGDAVPASYAEMREQLVGYAERAEQAEDHVEWLLRNIHARQRALRSARGSVSRLSNSPEYRIGQKVLWFRQLTRRFRIWMFEKRHGPRFQWSDPTKRKPKEREKLPVEPELLPPGYTRDSDVID